MAPDNYPHALLHRQVVAPVDYDRAAAHYPKEASKLTSPRLFDIVCVAVALVSGGYFIARVVFG